MSIDNFIKLKEIDSLTKMRLAHEKTILEQKNRLVTINSHREKALATSSELKLRYSDLHQKLLETESKIKTADIQKQRLIDIGGSDDKIKHFRAEIESLELGGLNLLESLDQIQQELKDSQQFLDGLEKTYQEIKTEVDEEKNKQETSIKHLDMRLELLQEELPTEFRQTLIKVTAKKLAVGPFTRVETGSCYLCRYKISRIEESEIDMQKSLKTCPQCGRIFLPYGA